MIDLEPFTRIIWKNNKDKQTWINRLTNISRLYHHLEFEMFIRDYRKVITYHMHSLDEESYNLLRKYNLVFIPLRRSRIYSGFSHKHIMPKPNDPQIIYGVLTKKENEGSAIEFTNADKKGDHYIQGKLLGYPKCCLKFFSNIWGKIIDPIYEACINLNEPKDNKVIVNYHPFCNQALRYFGIRITPHLSCSAQCKETIEWGKEWYRVMKILDKESAEYCYQILSMPFTWNCYRGIVIVDTPLFKGISNSDYALEKKIVINNGWNI